MPSSKAGPPEADQAWVYVSHILGPRWGLSSWSRATGCSVLHCVMFLSCCGTGLVLMLDFAILPLQPTSTGCNIAFQPSCSASHGCHKWHFLKSWARMSIISGVVKRGAVNHHVCWGSWRSYLCYLNFHLEFIFFRKNITIKIIEWL